MVWPGWKRSESSTRQRDTKDKWSLSAGRRRIDVNQSLLPTAYVPENPSATAKRNGSCPRLRLSRQMAENVACLLSRKQDIS